jgi:predicted nucleotidyltransferase component of viral defense system
MEFSVFRDRLAADGYSDDTAYAKIAHDIVLKAVHDSGFHDNLTVKGGVVMSSMTDAARRATMDMDLDFLRHPLANDAIRRFVSGLNRAAPCRIRISGKIETLRQQEYKGKRIHLVLTDETGLSIETKIDFGVHAGTDVEQTDRTFKVVIDNDEFSLLANPNEQIFVEKLKSLLRFGSASTRFKDIFDMYYLSTRVNHDAVRKLLQGYIFDDAGMRENAISDIVARLGRVFGNKTFMRALSKPANAWLDVPAGKATATIVAFISSLE